MNINTIVWKNLSRKVFYRVETSQSNHSTDQLTGYVWSRFLQKNDFQTIYCVTDFCNILGQIVTLKIIETCKKLLKSESINRNDLINSVYLWLNFSILLSQVFLKHDMISDRNTYFSPLNSSAHVLFAI